MPRKKRLHELARELDVTTDRLMEIALRQGMRFSSNFNAVEPEQEEKLRVAVKGPIRVKKKPIVKIVKTAKQKAAEAAAQAAQEAGEGEELPPTELVYEPVVVGEPAIEKGEPVAAEEKVEKEAEKETVEMAGEKVEVEALQESAEVTSEGAEVGETEKTMKKVKEEKVVEEVKTKAGRKAEEKAPVEETAAARTEEPEKVKEPEPVKEVIKEKIEVPKPAPPKRQPAGEEPERPKRRRRRRRRKDRVAVQVEEAPVPGKKRSKMPTAPTVDHVLLSEGMTVKDLAEKLGIKAKDIIQKLMIEKGVIANINQVLDLETAKEIAGGYGVSSEEMTYEEEVALEDELKMEGEAVLRAPVVTLLGHVDHGKTTLLDAIRNTRVAEREFGGITQHIGAYRIAHNNHPIVFLDTPGHEAFTRLRARGANVTDIVILVVAADDGVMPQTIEAIQHAKAAGVPMIIAITKVDLPRADVEKVKKGLASNEILVESWGGEIVSVEVSGKTGQGVDDLLEMILLVSEMRELKAYPAVKGVGTVLEASLDRARGPVATVLVQNGTVKIGDFFLAGITIGRVKAIIDDSGERLDEVGPSVPVELLGFGDVPEAGDQFQVVEDESKARHMVAYRHQQSRASQMTTPTLMSLDEFFSKVEAGQAKELKLIIKADVRGSLEALTDAFGNLATDKVGVNILLAQPGAITESDILLAGASEAIVIGFNVRAQKTAAKLAEKEGVEIRFYNVIYEAIKDVRNAMKGLLEPTFKEVVLGKAEVRQVFRIPKVGVIAGCYVTDGLMQRNAKARVIREDVVIHEGKVGSLKRFKDDVREVKNGFECGIGIDNFQDIREGDNIEMFVKEEVAPEM